MWGAPAAPPQVHAGFPAWSSAPARRPLPSAAAMHTGDREWMWSTYSEEYGSAVNRSAYNEAYGCAENEVYSGRCNEVYGSAYSNVALLSPYKEPYGSTAYQGGPAMWRESEALIHTGFPTWPVAPIRRPLSIEAATHNESTAWMGIGRGSSTAHDVGRATSISAASSKLKLALRLQPSGATFAR